MAEADSVWFAGEKAAIVAVSMIGDDGFEDGVGEEIISWIREAGDDGRVPLVGEEGKLGREVLLDGGARVLGKV